jgi:hypothetical protein
MHPIQVVLTSSQANDFALKFGLRVSFHKVKMNFFEGRG